MKKDYPIFILVALLFSHCHFQREFPSEQTIDEISHSHFVLNLDETIDLGINQIYCASFGIAWQEIEKIIDAEITIDSLYKDLNQLHKHQDFQTRLSPRDMLNTLSAKGDKIHIESAYQQHLPFQFELKANTEPFTFGNQPVRAFGTRGGLSKVSSQVEILFYKNDQDFALRLFPFDKNEEIILYKTAYPAKASFRDLMKGLEDKIQEESQNLKKGNYWQTEFLSQDRLMIPKIQFNASQNFSQLIGNEISSAKGMLYVEEARQRIALVLDQLGKEKESIRPVGIIENTDLPESKNLFFNRPFLIMLKKSKAKSPYLLAWIANSELLIKE